MRGGRKPELPQVPRHHHGYLSRPQLGDLMGGARNPIPGHVVGLGHAAVANGQHQGRRVLQRLGLHQPRARRQIADTHVIRVEKVGEGLDVGRSVRWIRSHGGSLRRHHPITSCHESGRVAYGNLRQVVTHIG